MRKDIRQNFRDVELKAINNMAKDIRYFETFTHNQDFDVNKLRKFVAKNEKMLLQKEKEK